MATTDQINDLIANYTALKDFYEGERQALLNARNNLPAELFITRYVDEVNGLPGGDGSFAAPYNTFDQALWDAHKGQHLRIRLLSDAIWRDKITPEVSYIQIVGAVDDTVATTRRTLQMLNPAANNVNQAAGALFRVGGVLMVDVNLVVNPGNTSHFISEGFASFAFRNCHIDGTQTAGLNGLLFTWNGSLSLSVQNSTYSGMAGKWLGGHAAGTALDPATTRALIEPSISNV